MMKEKMKKKLNFFPYLPLFLGMLGLLGACGLFSSKVPTSNLVSQRPFWFSGDPRYAHYGKEGNLAVHPFFDYDPAPKEEQSRLNFFVTTPYRHPVALDMAPSSGQMYTQYPYCEQEDVWEAYDEEIDRPPYTEGIVPRMLDELGHPQRILVFGREKYYQKFVLRPEAHRVKLIGGIVEEHCPRMPCNEKSHWYERLLLVAVDPFDSELNKVKSMAEWEKRISWKKIKAFLENGRGRHREGIKEYPAYRLIEKLDAAKVWQRLEEKSYHFEKPELLKMRNSCYRLYDRVWSDIVQGEKKGLVQRFVSFYRKHGNILRSCLKFVRPSNINKNHRHHWFFAFLGGFFKMEDLEMAYQCDSKAWIRIPRVRGQGRLFEPADLLSKCTTDELMSAFPHAIIALSNRLKASYETYRYIDYDGHPWGTHQKVYSWVRVPAERLACVDEETSVSRFYQRVSAFPSDIRWRWPQE